MAERKPHDAFECALEAISHKERTTAEIGAWLAKREFTPAEIELAVGRLAGAGALDDEEFARRFAEDKRELRGWGPERIAQALAGRGLDPATIAAALAVDAHDDQLERAMRLLAKRGRAADDESSRAGALAFLARRGYDADLAYDAVRGFERHPGLS